MVTNAIIVVLFFIENEKQTENVKSQAIQRSEDSLKYDEHDVYRKHKSMALLFDDEDFLDTRP